MSPDSTSIDRLMRPLRIQYQKDLPSRIELLEKYSKSVASGTLEGEDVSELRSVAHKLAGTGTTFGFPEISENGRILESELLQSESLDVVSITGLLNSLVAACEKAAKLED